LSASIYLVSIINRKPINLIIKLDGAFNYNIEGIILSGIVNNKL
jgi:hypothetical protein